MSAPNSKKLMRAGIIPPAPLAPKLTPTATKW